MVPPRTAIEAELAEIWVEVLRLEKVGIHDNFFDLGGTSLLAVDLFARIEHRFGEKLPLTSLIEASTIEQLARLVVGATDQDSLVLIREGRDRDRPPLFLVHDGDGETMLYRNLALRLKSDHAVYGLQPYSRLDVPLAHIRVAEMAAYHIDKMRSVQPQGPYLIGGMCAGGVIAFEIALQLQSAGRKSRPRCPDRRGRRQRATQGLALHQPTGPRLYLDPAPGSSNPIQSPNVGSPDQGPGQGQELEHLSDPASTQDAAGRDSDEVISFLSGSRLDFAAGHFNASRCGRSICSPKRTISRKAFSTGTSSCSGQPMARAMTSLTSSASRPAAGLGPARKRTCPGPRYPRWSFQHASGTSRSSPGRTVAVIHRRSPPQCSWYSPMRQQ